MLLTLSVRSLKKLTPGKGQPEVALLDLPDFTMKQFGLRGLNISADLLAGWGLEDLDRLRDRADKAGCPCLVLIEDKPLKFTTASKAASGDRLRRLAIAANRLGCSALAIRVDCPDNAAAFEETAATIKSLMPSVERLELNLLIAQSPGLTSRPDRLTDLIKRIGGFRIGTLPEFAQAAASIEEEPEPRGGKKAGKGSAKSKPKAGGKKKGSKTGDEELSAVDGSSTAAETAPARKSAPANPGGAVISALRKLAPYAGAIHANVQGFSASGEHKGYDLTKCVAAIRAVGFVNTLAIDFTGTGDAVAMITKAKEILERAIADAGSRDDDDGDDALPDLAALLPAIMSADVEEETDDADDADDAEDAPVNPAKSTGRKSRNPLSALAAGDPDLDFEDSED